VFRWRWYSRPPATIRTLPYPFDNNVCIYDYNIARMREFSTRIVYNNMMLYIYRCTIILYTYVFLPIVIIGEVLSNGLIRIIAT